MAATATQTGVCLDRYFGAHRVQLQGLQQDNNTSLSLPCTGATIWDAGVLLASYFADHQHELVAGQRFLELGCGLGLSGIVASKCGAAHVMMTDGDVSALMAAEKNCVGNNTETGVCEYGVLMWGKGVVLDTFLRDTCQNKSFDVMVAADCIYEEYQIKPLMETIACVLTHAHTTEGKEILCYLGFSRRGVPYECVFDEAEKQGLHLKPIPNLATDLFGTECSTDSDFWVTALFTLQLSCQIKTDL
eukprot:GDKI01006858.1.p1 GENE.GDKI01006858.1~~GDKI01006858.1.p1  ORF type:complete len:246 (+),score=69.83 GDKI01006858.1:241-978(+)